MERSSTMVRAWFRVCVILVILLGAYGLSRYHYLLYHSSIELFSIVVGCAVFLIAWNTRRYLDYHYFLYLGITYLFVSILDAFHMLAYHGMGVFSSGGSNLATQLWIAARSVEVPSLLIACLFLRRRMPVRTILLAYFLLTGFLLGSIFFWGIFPACFVEGAGLTPFKTMSEYMLCLILLATAAVLFRNRHRFERSILLLLFYAITATIAAELLFTLYSDPYGVFNGGGHLLKLISFYFIYMALIETGLRRPYALLFRSIREREERLKELNETLEYRVAESLMTAREQERQLSELEEELVDAEQRERRRLSGVLHDHLQQMLVAARLNAAVLRGQLQDANLRRLLGKVIDMLKDSIDMSRSLSAELCPPVLDEEGLVPALEWLGRQYRERHNLNLEVKAEIRDEPKSPAARAVLFQAVRELTLNAVKHGDAEKVRVWIGRVDGKEIEITVEDDGTGFDPAVLGSEKADGGGLGHFNIRRHIHQLGGRMEVESALGRGTRVTLAVPCKEPEEVEGRTSLERNDM